MFPHRIYASRTAMMVARWLAFSLLVVVFGTACGTTGPFIWVHDLPPQARETPRIKAGDTIQVTVRDQPTMSGQIKVQPNGTYVQPQLGAVAVASLTEKRAAARVAQLLKGILVDPQVNVAISIPGNNQLSVVGEVARSGRVQLRPNDGMLELLALVGGLTQFADRSGIYVVRKTDKGPLRVRFDYDRLLVGEPKSVAFKLWDGDIVTVK